MEYSKRLGIIIALFFLSVILSSCTSQTQTPGDINNTKAVLQENKTELIHINTTVSIPNTNSSVPVNNFSVISEDLKETEKKAVQGEDYNLSLASEKNNCYDSDGGFTFSLKGYIKDTQDNIFKDYCKDQRRLVEYKCGLVGFKEEAEESCLYGCDDGACKAPNATELCTDSDGGLVYGKKGEVSYRGNDYTDSCKNDNYLKEQFCTSVGINSEVEQYCADGCVDGVCISNPIDNQASCVDSDFGTDERYTKGSVTDKKGVMFDSCMNSATVEEYKCNVVGYRMKENIFCPDGYVCNDGACVKR